MDATFLKEIKYLFKFHDEKANDFKPRFEWVWYSGIFSGVAAVIVFAIITIYGSYLLEPVGGLILPILEVILVIYSVFTLSVWTPKPLKKFIDHRRSAEILRLHQLFYENNINIKPSRFQLEEYNIPTDILAFEDKYKKVSTEKADDNKAVLSNLLEFIDSQTKYHKEDRINKFHKKEHILELVLKIILWVFVSIILLKLVIELCNYSDIEYLYGFKLKKGLYAFKFSVICLPPLYAALEGLYYFSEWKRNIKVSEEVNKKYEILLAKIEEGMKSPSSDRGQVKTISDELYNLFHNENQNWYKWYSSRKIEAKV